MTRNDAPTMNPLVLQRADPCVLRHGDEYFFTASHPEYDRIILRRAAHLDDLQCAEEVTIWRRHEDGPQSHLIWAPEIHRIDDAWYIYYAAAPNEEATVDVPGTDDTFTTACSCWRTPPRIPSRASGSNAARSTPAGSPSRWTPPASSTMASSTWCGPSSISTSRAIPTSTSPGCTTPGPWPPRRSSSAAPSTTGRSAASGSTRARPCWFVTERSI